MSVADKDEHCMCVAATTRETLCMLNMSWRETALELMQAMGFFFSPLLYFVSLFIYFQ